MKADCLWEVIYSAVNSVSEKYISKSELASNIVLGEGGFGLDSLDCVELEMALEEELDNVFQFTCCEVRIDMTGSELFHLIQKKLELVDV